MDKIMAIYTTEDGEACNVVVRLPEYMADFYGIPETWELELPEMESAKLRESVIDGMLEQAADMLPELYEALSEQLEDEDWTLEEGICLEGEEAVRRIMMEGCSGGKWYS